MKHILRYIILFLIFTCCKEEKIPKIAIYLPKETVKNSRGIPIEKFAENHPNKDDILKNYGNKNFSIDTIKKKIICCSNFSVSRNDLEKKPFISDKEIKGFNFQNSSIKLSKSALEKLLKLPNNSSKQQFSICINGNPILNGYFLTISSKYLTENYNFTYHYAFDKDNLQFETYDFWLRYGDNLRGLDSINEKKFYEALKKTNRILK